MLINASKVKRFALEVAAERYHKKTRVSKEFLIHIDGVLKAKIRDYIYSLPSKGRTIK